MCASCQELSGQSISPFLSKCANCSRQTSSSLSFPASSAPLPKSPVSVWSHCQSLYQYIISISKHCFSVSLCIDAFSLSNVSLSVSVSVTPVSVWSLCQSLQHYILSISKHCFSVSLFINAFSLSIVSLSVFATTMMDPRN
jgi:hypothetical protein